jgi:hypothetical protein
VEQYEKPKNNTKLGLLQSDFGILISDVFQQFCFFPATLSKGRVMDETMICG